MKNLALKKRTRGPNLHLMFKLHEIRSIGSQEIIKIVPPDVRYFKAKMHQIRFRLGLRLRPRWGSLQRSPRPPSCIEGGLLLRERGGREGEGRY